MQESVGLDIDAAANGVVAGNNVDNIATGAAVPELAADTANTGIENCALQSVANNKGKNDHCVLKVGTANQIIDLNKNKNIDSNKIADAEGERTDDPRVAIIDGDLPSDITLFNEQTYVYNSVTKTFTKRLRM